MLYFLVFALLISKSHKICTLKTRRMWRNNCCVEVTLPLSNECTFLLDMLLKSVGCLLPLYPLVALPFKIALFPTVAVMKHSLYCLCVERGSFTEVCWWLTLRALFALQYSPLNVSVPRNSEQQVIRTTLPVPLSSTVLFSSTLFQYLSFINVIISWLTKIMYFFDSAKWSLGYFPNTAVPKLVKVTDTL